MFNFPAENALNEKGFDLRELCFLGRVCNFVVQMVNIVYCNSIYGEAVKQTTQRQQTTSFPPLIYGALTIDIVLILIVYKLIKLGVFYDLQIAALYSRGTHPPL